MNWLIQTIIVGITSFVATNIDDLVILTLFFAQVNVTFRISDIVLGQYLGFVALIIVSLPGFFGGLIIPKTWIGLLGLVPIAIGVNHLFNREEKETQVQAVSELNCFKTNRILSTLASFLNPQTFNVAAATFANGGDNIGIYIPLFASSNLASLAVILSIFLIMVGLWLYIAYLFTCNPAVAHPLTRYGNKIVPFVLIGLGIFILIENGTYQLLVF